MLAMSTKRNTARNRPEESFELKVDRDYPAPEHFDAIKKDIAEIKAQLDGLTELAVKIDETIGIAGLLLDKSQPYRDGRIGIRWWIDKYKRRKPETVRWSKNMDKMSDSHSRFYPERIDSGELYRHIKYAGSFELNANQTREIAAISSRLFNERESTRKALADTRRIYTLNLKRMAKIEENFCRLLAIGDEVDNNIKKAAIAEAEKAKALLETPNM
jgi:hypothetical protein